MIKHLQHSVLLHEHRRRVHVRMGMFYCYFLIIFVICRNDESVRTLSDDFLAFVTIFVTIASEATEKFCKHSCKYLQIVFHELLKCILEK
ncbi:hypothetical protein PBCV1_a291R [Paramecium bursaria Chlorella virus 1]|uniref:Uncharacterized protein n=1 Tax=Paramecium bursaria Chlorella virus 1 TaxID=10506 RepID=Q84607_PBCV1|nr:hypothetical protein PBCV1_a291R [Paramecium bursaria Chlorella virus 1]AAC96659.1 hypothetical protein [Paramecium bursaria Chlorella virus 1]